MSHPRPLKRLVARWAAVALAYALALAVVPSLPASVAGPAGGAASAQEGQLPQIPVIAPGSAYRQTNLLSDVPGLALPLPGFAQKTQPVVFFMLDTSGSMNACDGGEVLPSRDLTVKAAGGFLYDPLADAGDDGACTGRTAAGPYQITRLEATKLSID